MGLSGHSLVNQMGFEFVDRDCGLLLQGKEVAVLSLNSGICLMDHSLLIGVELSSSFLDLLLAKVCHSEFWQADSCIAR